MMNRTKRTIKDLTYQINGAAIEVHKTLGPGLLESTYHKCMKEELKIRGLNFSSEQTVPLSYKGKDLNTNLRCDLIVEDLIVVELKAIDSLLPIHAAQLLTYMQLLQIPKGILLNFNVVNLYHGGQKTYVNHFFSILPDV
jgi:GxxExxY protein